MKTYTKLLLLVLVSLACLIPQISQAYYNPSTGRWLNRDAIEEEGGENLYSILKEDCINRMDYLGNAAIRIGFGYDTSVQLISKTTKSTNKNLGFLFAMIFECIRLKYACECQLGEVPAISAQHDRNQSDKQAPADNSYLLVPQDEDWNLAVQSISRISVGSIHVLLTVSALEHWDGGTVIGNSFHNGILYNFRHARPCTLAHELGHIADYRGNDSYGIHSTDSKNLMYESGGSSPDCQWCQKVFSLAR